MLIDWRRALLAGVSLSLGAMTSASCGTTTSSSEVGNTAATCADLCAKSGAAHCPADTNCQMQCTQSIASTPPSCRPQSDAYTACAAAAVWTCNEDGESEATACDAQLTAWSTCVFEASGAADAGTTPSTESDTDGGAGNTPPAPGCAASTSADPCTACSENQCCAELRTCAASPTCRKDSTCVSACGNGDAVCIFQCVSSASSEFRAATSCALGKCAACR
jgi:hypothetical protein